MRMYADNYKLNYNEEESYQDFHQSFPQNNVKKSLYKKVESTLYFNIPVNYCPYLLFEISKEIKSKLKTNCFQIDINIVCLYDGQNFNLSISSKKGPLTISSIIFELEKYLRKLNLSNPISLVDIKIIESHKKLKVVKPHNDNNYNVFSSMNYTEAAEDIYLGLVKLDLEPRH